MIRMKLGGGGGGRVQLIPHCSATSYRTQSDVLLGNTLIAIMPRLTELEKGSNGFTVHTQRQVAVQCDFNVRTIQRLRVTGRVTNRPRSGYRYAKRKEGRKEMLYSTTHSTHFIYGYMALDIWQRTTQIVREEGRKCCI